jgi:hypothetical protein
MSRRREAVAMENNSEFCSEYRNLIESEKAAWSAYEKAKKLPSLARDVENGRRKMREHLKKCAKCAKAFEQKTQFCLRSICALFVGPSLLFMALGVIRWPA